VMGDNLLRRRLAERSVEARERFSIERVAGLWEALFRKKSSWSRAACSAHDFDVMK
jgi:hypothetical protein